MNINIERETILNEYYRKVIYTDQYQQVVLMSIPVGEYIPLEKHEDVSQFFRIEKGEGEIRFGKDEGKELVSRKIIKVTDGSAVVVPPKTYHHVVNTGNKPLKLYTIYSPPEHPSNRLDLVKPVEKKNNLLLMLLLNY